MTKKKTKKKPTRILIQDKRVAIAKDALLQLKAGIYDPKFGNGYVPTLDDVDFEGIANGCEILVGESAEKVELKSYLDKLVNKKKPCEVCAKGALFLSSVRKFNNFSIQDAADHNGDISYWASNIAEDIFGVNNAKLIEAYFEGASSYLPVWLEQEMVKIDKFGAKYPNSVERLEVILKNIIKNKGTFKPEVL